VILIGHPGTGKTHIATALGIAACGQGKRVRFHRVTELITALYPDFRTSGLGGVCGPFH
jgi:DNA replication protein DnaC